LPLDKSAQAMTLPDGFTATLFAGEPDVHQPIGFCIDHRGRLWVAENDSYPKWEEHGKDRIVIFEDTDGDGRFDKRTVTFLTAPEVDALLAAPDQSRWEGRRDRILMLLAVQTGLRVSELTGLNCGDVTLDVGAHVRCEGKGRRQRAVPLTSPVEALLRVWLRERAGRPNDPLFPTRTGRRLTRDAVALRVSTHASTAAQRCPSLLGRRIHPHVLRHSCAMSLLQAGVDTSVIALWLGHAGVRSTDAYLHADLTIKEKALALTTPAAAPPGRYRPPDKILAFLEGL